MSSGRGNTYPVIVLALFIALEFAGGALLSRSSTLQDIWFNRMSHRVMGALWGGTETIRNHFNLQKQNDQLREENFRLSEELRALKEAGEMLTEEAELVKGSGSRFTYIPATVVKLSKNSSHNYIILNKGRADGIKPNSGIISSLGVVGVVSAVDEHFSYGLTLMNSKISVSARVGRTGIVAPLVRDGVHTDRAYLSDLPLHYEIPEKDTVRTSGFSSIFPPDIPIGVTGLSNMMNGSTNRTEVFLFQNFSALRYVTVVNNPVRDEITSLEKKDEEGHR